MSFFGSLLGAVGSFFGGKSEAKAQRESNERNYEMQKEFAQNGIQWKVKDAKKAGIHPLYAIGAPSMSASPSFASEGNSGIGQAAQHLGNAVSARQDKIMQSKKEQAELDLLHAQADKVRSDMIVNMKKASDGARGRQAIRAGGQGRNPPGTLTIAAHRVRKNPGFSDTQDIEDRYGDPVSWFYGLGTLGADAWNEYKHWQKTRKVYKPKKHRSYRNYR